MGASRRAGPAAVAAALIGAGLLLYRPRLVPELSAGPRGRAALSPALASAIPWPPPSAAASSAPGAAAPAAPAAPAPESAEVAAWRDALADRPFLPLDHAGAASAPAAARASPGPRAASESSPAPGEPPARDGGARVPGPSRPGAAPRASRAEPAPAPDVPEASRRAPLALGPAPADDASEAGENADAVDARRTRGGAAGGAWRPRRARFFPLFRPPRRAALRGPDAAARRRARPLLLSRALGRGALRPPPSSVVPPDLSGLARRKPARLPDGAPAPSRPLELEILEDRDPRLAAAADRRRAPHWDEGLRWHDGPAQGLAAGARWLWLWKEKARWWAVSEPEQAPLLRHRELWWGKRRGVWFALHDGELWSWRRFSDWNAEGLIRLGDGVELVYSADFAKVAVLTPGAGAVLYDARTGAELGEWSEDELPRRRPRAPAGLRLPRGI